MRVIDYLTQTAVLERQAAGGTRFHGRSFTEPESIRVRWYTAHDLARTTSGEEVTTTARITTLTDVGLGDQVTDSDGRTYTVIQVRRNTDVRGRFSHYVALLQ